MINKVLTAIKNIDSLGKNVDLTYRKENLFSTFYGGCVSIIIIACLSLYLYFLLDETIRQSVPIVIQDELYSMSPEITFLTDNRTSPDQEREGIHGRIRENTTYLDISFALRNLTSNDIVMIDRNYLELVVFFNEIKDSKQINTTRRLQYSLCQKFGEIPAIFFYQLSLNFTYCIDESYSIKGDITSPNYKTLNIYLSRCQVGDQNSSCADDQAYNDYVSELMVEVYYIRKNFNISDYDHPITENLETFHYYLIPDYQIFNLYAFSIAQLISYESYLTDYFSFEKTMHYKNQLDYKDGTLNYSKRDLPILILIIHSKTSTPIIHRKYFNLLEQLSLFGGFNSILISLGFIITYSYVLHQHKESMVNDFYNVIDPKKDHLVTISFENYLKERLKICIIDYQISHNFKPSNLKLENLNQSILDHFFELGRLIKIMNIKINDPIFLFDFSDSSQNYQEEYSKITKNIKKDEYYKYKIIFDIFKYEVHKGISISFLEYFGSIFCKCFLTELSLRRIETFKIAKEKLHLDVDFISIVKSVNEFENAKKIYFDNNQNVLFDTLANNNKFHTSIVDEEKLMKKSYKGLTKNISLIMKEIIDKSEKSQVEDRGENKTNSNHNHIQDETKEMKKLTIKDSNYISKFHLANKMKSFLYNSTKNLYSDKNVCCCFRKKNTNQQGKISIKKISAIDQRKLKDMIQLELILDHMRLKGMSSCDKKLLTDLGIDTETISHFISYSNSSNSFAAWVKDKEREQINEELGNQIISLVNEKFACDILNNNK
jgi:hypothetical protein